VSDIGKFLKAGDEAVLSTTNVAVSKFDKSSRLTLIIAIIGEIMPVSQSTPCRPLSRSDLQGLLRPPANIGLSPSGRDAAECASGGTSRRSAVVKRTRGRWADRRRRALSNASGDSRRLRKPKARRSRSDGAERRMVVSGADRIRAHSVSPVCRPI